MIIGPWFYLQAVLGKEAVAGQRNIVQLEMSNQSEEIIHYPILSLTLGRNDMVRDNLIGWRCQTNQRRSFTTKSSVSH